MLLVSREWIPGFDRFPVQDQARAGRPPERLPTKEAMEDHREMPKDISSGGPKNRAVIPSVGPRGITRSSFSHMTTVPEAPSTSASRTPATPRDAPESP